MKPTQITELLANIKKTFVSFFSILMFAALGVGVFLGISWAGPALQNAAEKVFDEGVFHSFQIQYPYGLTNDDLRKLSEIEGVTQVEPGYLAYQTMMSDDKKGSTVKVQTLGQDIDISLLVEGELPTKSDEMAFHAESAKNLNVSVGDTVTFVKDADSNGDTKENANTSGMKYLTSQTFKVTAIINSPDYLAKPNATYGYAPTASGAVDGLAWLPDSSFDASAFQGGYPIVNVKCDELMGLNTFSEDYKARSKEVQTRIAELGDTLATERYDDLHGQAQEKIEDAEANIAQGEKDIADGEKQLEEGRKELEQKRTEGQAQLDSAYQKLMDAESQKASAEGRLSSARSKVNKAESKINEVENALSTAKSEVSDARSYKAKCDKELAAGKITQDEYNRRLDKRGAQATKKINSVAKKYDISVPSIDHTNYAEALSIASGALSVSEDIPVTFEGKTMTLREARKKLKSAKSELSKAESTYNSKVAELDNGWAQYYEGQETLKNEVAKAEKDIADGEKRINDAKKQVEDAKPKLEDAKAKFAEMVKYDWTLLPRTYNSGVGEVSTFSGVTNNLSISMAALFIIVGLLVSYFAVSRIVREQITQIGTKKALGFRRGEVTINYLLYSGLAVLAGAIIGAIVGFVVVEGIIGGVLADMFAFGAYPAYFGWGLFLIVTLAYLILVLVATYLACRSILKEHAVELLKGPKPPIGKTHFYEKLGIWEKLPLFVQTIVNNCVNDKRRVLSTIVGVAGATALIVTAITLNNDVLKSYDRQYEAVYGFNAIAYVEPTPEQAIDEVGAALQKEGATTAQVFMKSYLMEQPNGESGAIRIIVPQDNDAFAELYHVNCTTGGSFDPTAEGVWVSQAYADHFGAKVGDMLLIDDGNGSKHEVPILGFYEFWLTYHEAIMGHDYFEKEFSSVSPNVVLANTGDTSVEVMQEAINTIEGFDSITDDKTYQHGNFEMFSTVSSAVVAIYLALAALMAVVVLLNLNVMFIEEKKRDLIVLMINGFSVKDARHYISYDNIVMTALGIIVGIVLGCIMGSITVASIEPSTAVFVKSIDAWAVIIGILGSALLAVIMSIIALRRINNFKLTDINRF